MVTEIDSILDIEIIEEKYISSASKYAQTPEEAPSSITIIDAHDIKSFGYQTLTELLNAQRGFFFSDDRSNINLGIRGFGSNNNNRVLLLIDGHRLNPFQIDFAPVGSLNFDLSQL